MAKRIKDLNPASTLSDTDVIVVDQTNQSGKETLDNLKTYITSDVVATKATTTYVDAELATKSDTTYVDAELATKSDAVAVVSIAALKGLTGSADNQSVEVLGYHTEGDGGGGTFYWDAGSTDADNGGTIIESNAGGTGRWKRVYSGAVNVKWFGAKGDGSTDDQPAIQVAVNLATSVYIPNGTYRCVSPVTVSNADVTLEGDGDAILFGDPIADYLGIIDVVANNVTIKNLIFKGNGVSTGTTGTYGTSGSIIRGDNIKNMTVTACVFRDIVSSDIDAGYIGFSDVRGVLISDNTFEDTNSGGKDISIPYRVGECQVINNHSHSDSDAFCHLSVVGEAIEGNINASAHHIIDGNIYYSQGGRHGIIVHYNGGNSHSIITNNILVGGTRHGIFLGGSTTVAELNSSGPDIVSNNIIRNFGGDYTSAVDYPFGYNAGILMDTMAASLIQGNLIEDCGYNVNGTERSVSVGGISILRACANVCVTDNIVKNTKGQGIILSSPVQAAGAPDASDYNIDNLSITGNTLIDNSGAALVVRTGGDGSTARYVNIKDNRIRGGSDQPRISLSIKGPTSTNTPSTANIIGNTCIGDNTQIGIAIHSGLVSIKDNTISNCEIGISNRNIDPNGDDGGTTYSIHKTYGTYKHIEANTFIDCTTGVQFSLQSRGQYSFIHPSNKITYSDSFTGTSGISTGLAGSHWNRTYFGEVTGENSLGETTCRIYATGPSTDADSMAVVGDTIVNSNPSVGAPDQWRCTTAGGPGTWSHTGALS